MLRLSTLLVVCMCMVMVVRGSSVSESESEISKFHGLMMKQATISIAKSAHAFRTLQAGSPTSSVFNGITGVSATCQTSSAAIENNATTITANKTVVASGCIAFDPTAAGVCDFNANSCQCVTTYTGDVNLTSVVKSQGGQVCQFALAAAATGTSKGNKVVISLALQGVGGELIVGGTCSPADFQTTLAAAWNTFTGEVFALNDGTTKLTSIVGFAKMCGSQYNGTSTKNAAGATASPQAAAFSLLFAAALMVIAML